MFVVSIRETGRFWGPVMDGESTKPVLDIIEG